jgi:formylglycine-generating enzyme required for sulfatase activity
VTLGADDDLHMDRTRKFSREPDDAIGVGFRCVQGQPFGPVDDMIAVPAGAVREGCIPLPPYGPSDGTVKCIGDDPPIEVEVSAFEIDRQKVTAFEYQECVDAQACAKPEKLTPDKAPADPVEATWDEATAFCQWRGKRLPLGTEWEKAARNGDARPFPWGNELPDCTRADFAGYAETRCSSNTVGTHPAGASPFGVMDMVSISGEWTVDGPEGPRYPEARTGRGAWTPFRDVIWCPKHHGPTSRIQFRCAR